MNGEEKRAAEHQQVAGRNGEALFHTQQVKTHYGDAHAQPGDLGDLLFDKDAQQRHDHDIQRGDKARLSRGGHADAELLERAGHA